MPLWTPASQKSYGVDNWGANPSATPGVAVTPGASSAEGSWTASGLGTLANEVCCILVRVSDGNVAATARNHFLDIGVDPAGGTSYAPIINDLVCGSSGKMVFVGSGRRYFFPIRIPSGATVGFRIQGSDSTAGTVRVGIRAYGQQSHPWLQAVGQYSETIGAGASTLGTSFTPGNAADGAWASLGTTMRECWWWQLGYQIDNTVMTAEYTYIELAYGDASNKHVILRLLHSATATGAGAEGIGDVMDSHLVEGYMRVPAGGNLYVRGRCDGGPDTGYNAAAVGIGG